MHREGIELDIEVDEEQEEALEEVEDQWYTTIFKNHDTMQENVHFHLRRVCIVMHQISSLLQHSSSPIGVVLDLVILHRFLF